MTFFVSRLFCFFFFWYPSSMLDHQNMVGQASLKLSTTIHDCLSTKDLTRLTWGSWHCRHSSVKLSVIVGNIHGTLLYYLYMICLISYTYIYNCTYIQLQYMIPIILQLIIIKSKILLYFWLHHTQHCMFTMFHVFDLMSVAYYINYIITKNIKIMRNWQFVLYLYKITYSCMIDYINDYILIWYCNTWKNIYKFRLLLFFIIYIIFKYVYI